MGKQIIFKTEQEGWQDLLGVAGLSLFWLLITIGLLQSQVLTVMGLMGACALIYYTLQTKFDFSIDEDGIEFFQIVFHKPMEYLKYGQIQLVRFEDGFKTSGRGGKKDRIFIYPYKKTKISFPEDGDYIPLVIGEGRDADIIKILQYFQAQKVEVMVKTRRRKIKQSLLPTTEVPVEKALDPERENDKES